MNQRILRIRLWRWAAVLAVGGYLAAQEAQPPDETDPAAGEVVFRTETALMEVEVRATLRRGELVEGLTREDFQLFENGEPQEIVSFEYVDYPHGEALVARGERLTQAAGIESPDPSQSSSEPRPSASQELRIFIATHISEAERLRVHKSVRRFIENDLPDHALVSLNGTPFVSDRELLLALIDKTGLVDVLSGNNFSDIRPRIVSNFDSKLAAQRQDWNALLRGVDPTTPTQLFNMFDDHLSRIRTMRYVDLIRDLSIYPGKKMIVLFSRGHPMGFDRFQQSFMGAQDAYLLERLKGESMRARDQPLRRGCEGSRSRGCVAGARFRDDRRDDFFAGADRAGSSRVSSWPSAPDRRHDRQLPSQPAGPAGAGRNDRRRGGHELE